MGLHPGQPDDAGYCARAACRHAVAAAGPVARRGIAAWLTLAFLATACLAEPLRIATYHVELGRRGPGLLARDIRRGAEDVAAAVDVIAALDPDVLLLQGVDIDPRQVALGLFAERLAAAGAVYPHRFAFASNRGMPSGRDLDGDGRIGGPGDAQGYGRFRGAGGMALLSRLPVLPDAARDFSDFLWRDLPGSGAPRDRQIAAVWRLSSGGHWEVPLRRADGSILRLLAFHASPPVFGAADGRNLRRNRDEIRFWKLFLDGWAPDGGPGAQPPFVIAGVGNLDPEDGEGDRSVLRDLLADSRLRDPRPVSEGGRQALRSGADARHRGDPAQDTAIFDPERGPGRLRLDYLLPSADLTMLGSGVFWPAPGQPLADRTVQASRHRPVWIDIE